MKLTKVTLYSISLLLMILFFIYRLNMENYFIVQARFERLISIVLVSITIGYSTVVFQTISSNKFLTPSLLGYEYRYVFVQVLLLLIVGTSNLSFNSKIFRFIISCSVLIFYSFVLFRFFFNKNRKNIYHILLIGLILGIFFSTATQFLQTVVDPDSFGYVQAAMFANLNKVTKETVYISATITSFTLYYILRDFKYLNVIALGREKAINLGVDYDAIARKQLLGISVLVSVSSASVGPITFVGIFVSGMTYRIASSENHQNTIVIAIPIALILLLAAQFLIEHILNYKFSMAIIVNLLGSLYFIVLLLKLFRN